MTAAILIGENTEAAAARRKAEAVASRIGFGETRIGQLAIVVMELATNIIKHAQRGEMLISECRDDVPGAAGGGRTGIEVLALDKGRGVPNLEAVIRDGHSTAGSLGHGLGAVSRLSDDFEVFSQPSGGAALLSRLWPDRRPRAEAAISLGAVNVAKAGETVCGDAWSAKVGRHAAALLLADGLGHGVLAAEAAAAALGVFARDPIRSPSQTLEDVHAALRPTRGAAVAVAAIDVERGIARYAGLGNVAGAIVQGTSKRNLVSHNGTAGHIARHFHEFSYPMPAASVLVMHSDGLSSSWNAKDYPGLWERDPSLVAGVLYRDFTRRRDDATVLVGRRNI
jgi:anti-sigma regulatory factor (Ser/Thr protein kinase)